MLNQLSEGDNKPNASASIIRALVGSQPTPSITTAVQNVAPNDSALLNQLLQALGKHIQQSKTTAVPTSTPPTTSINLSGVSAFSVGQQTHFLIPVSSLNPAAGGHSVSSNSGQQANLPLQMLASGLANQQISIPSSSAPATVPISKPQQSSNALLTSALINSTTANLIAQLATSVSAGMLSLAQLSITNAPSQGISSTMSELNQLLASITSLASNLTASLPNIISMYVRQTAVTAANTPTNIQENKRFITLRVVPSSTAAVVNTSTGQAALSSSFGSALLPNLAPKAVDHLSLHELLTQRSPSEITKRATESGGGAPKSKRSAPELDLDSIPSTSSESEIGKQDDDLDSNRTSPALSVNGASKSVMNEAILLAERKDTPAVEQLTSQATLKTGADGKTQFVCPVEPCKRAFSKRSDLRQHLYTHTGERPHVCNQCPAAYVRYSHLRRHRMSHVQREISELNLVPSTGQCT